MGSEIILSVLQRGKSHNSHVNAEIKECGIEPPTYVNSMKWKEVVDLLRIDEYKQLVQLELTRRMVKERASQSDQIMKLFK